MAVLFSGLQVTLAGVQSSSGALVVSSGSRIRLTMDASVFPLGTTTLSIGISTDGGATFKSASMTCVGGIAPNGSNTYIMTYELDPDSVVTHTKVTVDAALGFSSNTLIEAL